MKSGNRSFVVSLRVIMTLTEGLCHPAHDFVIQHQSFQKANEVFLENLLPGVRLGAFALIPA
jgi:hypothetical protein